MSARALPALLLALAAAWAAARGEPAPCPCRPGVLPADLDGLAGSPAEEREHLAAQLAPAEVSARRYGEPGPGAVTAVLAHYHRLDPPRDLFGHTPEACLGLRGWGVRAEEGVDLGAGRRARRFLFARGGRERIVHVAWLDAAGARPVASLARAWLLTLGRGLAGQPTGGGLLVLATAELPPADAWTVRVQDRRMGALLAAVAVRGGARTGPADRIAR